MAADSPMKGFRSIAALLVSGALSPAIANYYAIPPELQAQFAAAIVSGVGIFMRLITHAPVFASARKGARVSQESIDAIALATAARLLKEKQNP